jgi:hypothetical protein
MVGVALDNWSSVVAVELIAALVGQDSTKIRPASRRILIKSGQ